MAIEWVEASHMHLQIKPITELTISFYSSLNFFHENFYLNFFHCTLGAVDTSNVETILKISRKAAYSLIFLLQLQKLLSPNYQPL